MVLKDWSKIGSKNTLLYWKRKSDNLFMQIQYKNGKYQVYLYYVDLKRNPTILVERKTWNEARREVTKYMRTH